MSIGYEPGLAHCNCLDKQVDVSLRMKSHRRRHSSSTLDHITAVRRTYTTRPLYGSEENSQARPSASMYVKTRERTAVRMIHRLNHQCVGSQTAVGRTYTRLCDEAGRLDETSVYSIQHFVKSPISCARRTAASMIRQFVNSVI